ncbi:MAG TPA: FISUMP domain-containing protein [bacterium]|nr:FISUMP domain-containing protein [bacterium]
MIKNNKNKKGFTLIELIIVVFIIGLLATIVTISISGAKSRSRDVKRISEITHLQIALDNYNVAEGRYPAELVPGESLIGSSTGIVFMSQVPENFLYYDLDCQSEGYEYLYNSVDNNYEISFCLENKIDNYLAGNKCAVPNKILEGICCNNSISDIDGNSYKVVKIGNQCWMAENLNTGIMINSSISQSDDSTIEKYCYNNIEGNCDIYGGLYQWNEMMNYTTSTTQGICPTGWHVPTDSEWTELTRYVIDDPFCDPSTGCPPSGEKIKASIDDTPSWNGSNDFNFSALPSGYRNLSGVFYPLGSRAYFWSSTISEISLVPIQRNIHSSNNNIDPDTMDFAWGLSIRCIKD